MSEERDIIEIEKLDGDGSEIETQNHDARDNGLSHSIYTRADAPFDEKTYFASYHHYERFDPAKQYVGEMAVDYGHGIHCYEYSKYTVNIWEKEQRSEQVYVVAVEKLTDEESEALAPWCQCSVCSIPWFLIGILLLVRMCPCCCGCLTTSPISFDQAVIDATRERKKTHPPRELPMPTWKANIGLVGGFLSIVAMFAVGMTLVCAILAVPCILISLCIEYIKNVV